jgi:hypothetical protein
VGEEEEGAGVKGRRAIDLSIAAAPRDECTKPVPFANDVSEAAGRQWDIAQRPSPKPPHLSSPWKSRFFSEDKPRMKSPSDKIVREEDRLIDRNCGTCEHSRTLVAPHPLFIPRIEVWKYDDRDKSEESLGAAGY